MVTRLTGLASGFDTEATVTKLMNAARIPLDKLTQKKQLLQWQRDDYRSLNAKILAFRTAASDMKLPSKYQSKQVSSADDASVSVTATAAANEGVYKIKVSQLAETASLSSSAVLGAGSETLTLGGGAGIGLGLTADTTLTISGQKGSATIQLKTGDTIAQFIANANSKSNTTGVKVTYDSALDKVMFVTSATGATSNIDIKMQGGQDIFKLGVAASATKGQTIVGDHTFASSASYINNALTTTQQLKIQINGGTAIEFDVSKNTTVSQLVDSINASDIGKSKGVSAYVDSGGHLAFFNNNEATTVNFTDSSSGSLLTNLGLNGGQTVTSNVSYSQNNAPGKDAIIYFNGSADPVKYANNNFTISGMTFNAKKVTTDAVSVTVSKDVDNVYNTIKSFVDKYNELIDAVNTKTSEKKYPKFTPLTDEQKKAMKEDDITKWNEKAMSGMLSNDQILNSGMNSFRSSMSGIVQGLPTGQLNSLSEIGISTSLVSGKTVSGSYLEKGKLYIDEAKLKAAIADNPDEVMKLFLANDNDDKTSEGDGIATRMYDQANQLFNKISNKAGLQNSLESKYLIGKAMTDIDKQADSLSKRLDDLETRYYKQFTSMETYINNMNTVSANLTKQFG